ncbi:uncharacterized protein LOC132169570 [Corylus avellana]|uniref:uncharacterized protein LOC132169570 n=1 Tax=Corylus avellana TaxID=13451 RepID=UPI00286A7931|nr:uncharacterized protein LOC132169570 [Corylus avellana]
MEVYVDDMLVKSVLPQNHVLDLQETFSTLKRYGMKLNPSKCAFGVSSEKFLDYMVLSGGIEANPEKIQVVLDMQSLKNLKQLQRLMGRIAALNRSLRTANEVSDESTSANQTISRVVSYLYLVVSPTAVSATLIREEGIQWPMILTEYPLKKVLRRLDLSGRLANWAIELGEFDIESLPRNSLKGQALADFLAEFTNLPDVTGWPSDETWVIYVNGSSTKKHGGVGIVMITPDEEELCSSLKLKFKTTNNKAEYEAVLAGLGLACEMGAKFVEEMQSLFKKFCIVKIPRPENETVDRLARTASTVDGETEDETPIQILPQSSITEMVSVSTAETIPDWQLEIVEYLEKGVLPSDRKLATQLRIRAMRFTMVNGTLYKRGFMLPLLKCVSKVEGNYILGEIHEGICGSHSRARIMAHKTVRAGFYWPNMSRDSAELVRDCDKCQRFANVTHQPPEDLSAISSPWPFSQRGIDIVGPLPRGKGGVRFAVVVVDYFTKWAEVEALLNITANAIERNYYSSPRHPQVNGQVEATNITIFKILKKKLDDCKGEWAEDLREVWRAYWTNKRTPTKETPYALAFRTEAVIPAEVGSGSYRVETFQPETSNEGLQLHLDLLQEKRDQAQVTMSTHQARVARYFHRTVKAQSFKVGDMVLRRVTLATKDLAEGKLAPNLEGPYRVIQCKSAGAYHLEDSKGKALPRPWNAKHLKKYYV